MATTETLILISMLKRFGISIINNKINVRVKISLIFTVFGLSLSMSWFFIFFFTRPVDNLTELTASFDLMLKVVLLEIGITCVKFTVEFQFS